CGDTSTDPVSVVRIWTASTSPTAPTTSTFGCWASSATHRCARARATPPATGSWRASSRASVPTSGSPPSRTTRSCTRDEGPRMTAARSSSIPDRPEAITPDWLSEALAVSLPGVQVAKVEIVDRHAGTPGRARLRLAYASGSAGPETVFVKLPPFTEDQRGLV